MILRNQLAKRIFNQEIKTDMKFESLLEHQKEDYLKRADEIIALFVDAIKNLEFKID